MLPRATGRVLLGALALVVAGAGGAAVALLPDGGSAPPVAGPQRVPQRRALLPPPPSAAPQPLPARLAQALAPALRDPALGRRVLLSVVDARSGEPLVEQGARTAVVPASTAKIATAVAALSVLDPDARLRTVVVRGARPGEVVLVGGGDPVLAGPRAPATSPRPARLADLARQVRARLGTERVTRVSVDDSLFLGPRTGPGWRPGYVTDGDVAPVSALSVDGGRLRPGARERVPDPAIAAGRVLAGLLQPRAAIEVARARARAGAVELAAVESPTTSQLVERMLLRSDNDVAEALARHVARAQRLPPTFDGAADGLAAALARLGVTGVALLDGSGLSRLNRAQPGALARLVARSARDPRLAAVLPGLPVGGFSGTLSDRFRTGAPVPGAGVVRAKTGTLAGVSALAGAVTTRDGALLAFAVAADGVPPGGRERAERALDRIAAVLASCGCR